MEQNSAIVNKTYYDYNDCKRMKEKPDLDFFEEPFWVSFKIDEHGSNLLWFFYIIHPHRSRSSQKEKEQQEREQK